MFWHAFAKIVFRIDKREKNENSDFWRKYVIAKKNVNLSGRHDFYGIHGFRIIDIPKQLLMFQPRGAPGSLKTRKMRPRSGKTQLLCQISHLGGKS